VTEPSEKDRDRRSRDQADTTSEHQPRLGAEVLVDIPHRRAAQGTGTHEDQQVDAHHPAPHRAVRIELHGGVDGGEQCHRAQPDPHEQHAERIHTVGKPG